ncbi:unnamed protein product, partial [Iphiclides podalirius]
MEHPGGFASSPWAAMLGHGMHGMMQHDYTHAHAHASMPMDLHVPQAFPYYRGAQQCGLYGSHVRRPPKDPKKTQPHRRPA